MHDPIAPEGVGQIPAVSTRELERRVSPGVPARLGEEMGGVRTKPLLWHLRFGD